MCLHANYMHMEAVAYSEISEEMAMSVPGAAFRQTAKHGTCTPEVCLDFWECTPVLRLNLFIARLAGAMKNNI